MGMASFTPQSREGQSKKSTTIIDYITDVMFGLFTVPFFTFILKTTKEIFHSPLSIGEGTAILYIALLTSIYYVLSRKQKVVIDTGISNIIFILLGLILFFISVYF